jgi:hypothetical protein
LFSEAGAILDLAQNLSSIDFNQVWKLASTTPIASTILYFGALPLLFAMIAIIACLPACIAACCCARGSKYSRHNRHL